jgi:transposase-like protein
MTICYSCIDWHRKALDMLAGKPPPGCQQCGVTFAELDKTTLGGNLYMTVVPKDGVYQVLCPRCDLEYLRKRRDLVKNTMFAERRGIC